MIRTASHVPLICMCRHHYLSSFNISPCLVASVYVSAAYPTYREVSVYARARRLGIKYENRALTTPVRIQSCVRCVHVHQNIYRLILSYQISACMYIPNFRWGVSCARVQVSTQVHECKHYCIDSNIQVRHTNKRIILMLSFITSINPKHHQHDLPRNDVHYHSRRFRYSQLLYGSDTYNDSNVCISPHHTRRSSLPL